MSATSIDPELQEQIGKRRTFAIISHPDAGKTTLTEKLLLYSGMMHTAGMVRAQRPQGSHIRLDGDGAGTRHLDHRLCHAVYL